MPPPQDHTKALLEMQLRLQAGEPPDDVVRFLQSHGMPAIEARLTVSRVVDKSLREQRIKGYVNGALAIVCFAISAPFFVALISGLASGHTQRGFGRAMAQASALPALLFGAGSWLAYRALKFILSKRYAMNPDS